MVYEYVHVKNSPTYCDIPTSLFVITFLIKYYYIPTE